MSTFQVKGNNGTTVRIQTQAKKVFRVDGALRGPKGATGPAGNDGEDGRDIELQNNGTHVQWRYVGDEFWNDLVDISVLAGADGADGTNGTDGREVELQTSATHIQWRYTDGSWLDLIAIDDLKGADGTNGTNGVDGDDGREVEFQKSATHIQWRYVGDASWINLVALADLKGEDGTIGSDGDDGRTILSGSGAPSSGLGADGDFYINTDNYGIYGPKTAGAWGSPTSLVGPAGSGTGDMLASVYDPAGGARQVAFADELGGGGVTDHGALTGLGDDDHTQYHNDARGDARYYVKSAVDAYLAGKSDTSHNHTLASLSERSYASLTDIPSAFTPSVHTHPVTDLTATGRTSSNFLRGDNTWAVPTNTTYTEISEAEITAGSASTLRTISGRRAGFLKARANHTGTQPASTISDFDAEVSNNTDVAANTSHRSNTSNPHGVTASQVGLGNVDNTSDANKPVSTATQAALDEKATPADIDTEILGLGRMSLSNSYKRRVIHNLDYNHADASAAVALWNALYPQTFVIDTVANEILTISATPQVVSVYDWTTGAYKGRCFSLGRSGVTESAMIRYEGGTRYLYVAGNVNELARFDITTLPTNLTTISPANTYTLDVYNHVKYRNGRWVMFSSKQDAGIGTARNRGKFHTYDDSLTQKSMGEIQTVLMGGRDSYISSVMPKLQGFEEGPGYLAVGVGGGWNPALTKTPYYYQGIRLFTPNGSPIIDSLIDPELMIDRLTSEGYAPTLVEQEGLYIANGKLYSLWCTNTLGSVGAGDGGILIFEEFSDHEDAIDFSPDAVSWNVPDIDRIQTGNMPIALDGYLKNLMTWENLTNVADILLYMQRTGQDRFAFYSSDVTVTDINGNPIPTGALVEIQSANGATFMMRWYNNQTRTFKLYAGPSWIQYEMAHSSVDRGVDANGWRSYDFGSHTEYRRVITSTPGSIGSNSLFDIDVSPPVGVTLTAGMGISVGSLVATGGSSASRFNVGAGILGGGDLRVTLLNTFSSSLSPGSIGIPVSIRVNN